MLELQGTMAWVNGILIGIGVSLAGIFALIGTLKITTAGSDQRKHEEGVTTLRNVAVGVVAMALVIPLLNMGASRLGLATIAEPAGDIAPTAAIANITASAAAITINYTKTVRITNSGQLRLAIHNLTDNSFTELSLGTTTAETQTLTFGSPGSAGENIRILGYRYGTATIVDAATGDPAVSTFSQQQFELALWRTNGPSDSKLVMMIGDRLINPVVLDGARHLHSPPVPPRLASVA